MLALAPCCCACIETTESASICPVDPASSDGGVVSVSTAVLSHYPKTYSGIRLEWWKDVVSGSEHRWRGRLSGGDSAANAIVFTNLGLPNHNLRELVFDCKITSSGSFPPTSPWYTELRLNGAQYIPRSRTVTTTSPTSKTKFFNIPASVASDSTFGVAMAFLGSSTTSQTYELNDGQSHQCTMSWTRRCECLRDDCTWDHSDWSWLPGSQSHWHKSGEPSQTYTIASASGLSYDSSDAARVNAPGVPAGGSFGGANLTVINPNWTWNPSTDGAITGICWSYASQLTDSQPLIGALPISDPANTWSPRVAYGLACRQGGNVYMTDTNAFTQVVDVALASEPWVHNDQAPTAGALFTESSFGKARNGAVTTIDASDNPDFSASGGEIEFGLRILQLNVATASEDLLDKFCLKVRTA